MWLTIHFQILIFRCDCEETAGPLKWDSLSLFGLNSAVATQGFLWVHSSPLTVLLRFILCTWSLWPRNPFCWWVRNLTMHTAQSYGDNRTEYSCHPWSILSQGPSCSVLRPTCLLFIWHQSSSEPFWVLWLSSGDSLSDTPLTQGVPEIWGCQYENQKRHPNPSTLYLRKPGILRK